MDKDDYFKKEKVHIKAIMDSINKELTGLRYTEIMDIKFDVALSLLLHCLLETDKHEMLMAIAGKTLRKALDECKDKPHLRIVQ